MAKLRADQLEEKLQGPFKITADKPTPAATTPAAITPASTTQYYGPATSPDVAYDVTLGINQYQESYNKFLADQAASGTVTPITTTTTTPTTTTTTGKKAISSVVTTINGKQVQIITFDDGTTQQVDLGSSPTGAQNAYDSAKAQLTAWGIYKEGDAASAALLDKIKELALSGAGADTISLAIQQSDAYKARFAGNEARLKKGLAALTPAEYIFAEKTYDQILRAAGVPDQFYRTTGEMARLIGADVSATELSNRVDLAKKALSNSDPYYVQTLQNVYGLSTGDMVAHLLDPNAAMPLLEKQAAATSIGAEAARQGLGYSKTALESLAASNVTTAQAAQGFKNIALGITPAQKIATTWGGDAAIQGQNLVASTFGTAGAAYAEQQIQKLAQMETSAFQGSSGISKGSLGTAASEAAGGVY